MNNNKPEFGCKALNMKKLINFVMPMKLIAGGVLFGLIGFYMVVGALYARFADI